MKYLLACRYIPCMRGSPWSGHSDFFFFWYNRSFRIEDPPMDWKFSAAVGDVTNFSQIWRSKPSIQSFVLCISTTSNLENLFAWLYIVRTIRFLDPQTKDQKDPTHLYFGLEDHKLHSTQFRELGRIDWFRFRPSVTTVAHLRCEKVIVDSYLVLCSLFLLSSFMFVSLDPRSRMTTPALENFFFLHLFLFLYFLSSLFFYRLVPNLVDLLNKSNK